jgi:hypothetical protein
MFHNYLKILVYLLFFLLLGRHMGMALELHTRYAVIVYNDDRDLERFNEEIYLGKYNFLLQQEGMYGVADEVRLKIDLILDRVKEILNMFPEHEKMKIIICSSNEDIRKIHERIYGYPTSSTAFYAPDINMVFFSSADVELTTVAPEFSHVVMHRYFQQPPPVKIHELLSRYAARHIKD